jgi:hypothetical protein
MRRIKDATVLASELREYFKRKGIESSNGIANVTNINQSQIYRNLFSTPHRVGKTLKELCKYAKIDMYEPVPDPRNSATLIGALSVVWDGSEVHAKKISRALFAIKKVHL